MKMITCIALLASLLAVGASAAERDDHQVAPFAEMEFGTDYWFDVMSGSAVVKDTQCSISPASCDSTTDPCSFVLSGTCYYCDTPFSANFCLRHPGHQCVVLGVEIFDCGDRYQGTCTPAGTCVGAVLLSDPCHYKDC